MQAPAKRYSSIACHEVKEFPTIDFPNPLAGQWQLGIKMGEVLGSAWGTDIDLNLKSSSAVASQRLANMLNQIETNSLDLNVTTATADLAKITAAPTKGILDDIALKIRGAAAGTYLVGEVVFVVAPYAIEGLHLIRMRDWDILNSRAVKVISLGEYVPNSALENIGRGYGQAAEQVFRPWLREGVELEAARLDAIEKLANTIVWRPELADIESSAFKVIVGPAKLTPKGKFVGIKFDSLSGELLEIKHGKSVLDSSYQLRLETYFYLKKSQVDPTTRFILQSERPINPLFDAWLERWGVLVEKIE